MEIGLRQVCVKGFSKKFPLTSKKLIKDLENRKAEEFRKTQKPKDYKFELTVEYYPESDELTGELVVADNGDRFYEAKVLSVVGTYPGCFGDTKTAIELLHLARSNITLPESEREGIIDLFNQIKAYSLDRLPKEIKI